MTYPISAHSVKMKFPTFAQTPNERIEFAIEEAGLVVIDEGQWIDAGNFKLAFLYYTAHILMVEKSRAESETGQRIKSESIDGVMSVTYQDDPGPTEASIDDLTSTHYGLRFKDLATRNFPAVAVLR